MTRVTPEAMTYGLPASSVNPQKQVAATIHNLF